MIFMKLLWF